MTDINELIELTKKKLEDRKEDEGGKRLVSPKEDFVVTGKTFLKLLEHSKWLEWQLRELVKRVQTNETK